jgi:hypothetical protein
MSHPFPTINQASQIKNLLVMHGWTYIPACIHTEAWLVQSTAVVHTSQRGPCDLPRLHLPHAQVLPLTNHLPLTFWVLPIHTGNQKSLPCGIQANVCLEYSSNVPPCVPS